MREIFSGKIVSFDVSNGNGLIAILNEEQASKYGITERDKISLIRKGEEYIVDVALSKDYLKPGEIGVTNELLKEYPIQEGDNVLVAFMQHNPVSMQAIRKKMLGGKISDDEIDAIVEDIQNNKLSDLILAYYTSTSFFYKSDPHELAYTTKATAYTGDIYRFPGIVASKYCIGGVPGNETTMIIVPLLASLGITMPKTFSKSITSPAATGECVDVLMDISFDKMDIIKLIDKNKCCLAWNGVLNLAPANDRIIHVSAPLGMEPYARMISSIMAKNYAMGVNHCLIDIPLGPTAKVSTMKDAKRVAKHFEHIGKYLGIKMDVQITKAEQPIGGGIGASLQVREVLRVLQQHEKRPQDLEEKAIFLSARLIKLCGLRKTEREAKKLAMEQLKNGEAREMMQKIIKAQNGKNPNIQSEEVELGDVILERKAQNDGKISHVDMKYLNMIARTLGAPGESRAGLFLHVKLGDSVKKGETLYTLYSASENKMKMATDFLDEKDIYQIV